jgi:hypothetical protein
MDGPAHGQRHLHGLGLPAQHHHRRDPELADETSGSNQMAEADRGPGGDDEQDVQV